MMLTKALRILPYLLVAFFTVLVLSCARYSLDPKVATVQGLTDFCIGYRAMRDSASIQIKIDADRENPRFDATDIETVSTVRAFLKPYCSEAFDPKTEVFDLARLERELLKLRVLLLAEEPT